MNAIGTKNMVFFRVVATGVRLEADISCKTLCLFEHLLLVVKGFNLFLD